MNGPFVSNYIKPTLANTVQHPPPPPPPSNPNTHTPTTHLIDHLFIPTFIIIICTFSVINQICWVVTSRSVNVSCNPLFTFHPHICLFKRTLFKLYLHFLFNSLLLSSFAIFTFITFFLFIFFFPVLMIRVHLRVNECNYFSVKVFAMVITI